MQLSGTTLVSKILVTLFLFSISLVTAQRPETNAQRLSRGLPPLPPRRHYHPDRVRARDASPSLTPPVPRSGYIAVYLGAPTSTFKGYLSPGSSASNPDLLTYSTSTSSAYVVTFTPNADGSYFSINTPCSQSVTGCYMGFSTQTAAFNYLDDPSQARGGNGYGTYSSILNFGSRYTPPGSGPVAVQSGDYNNRGSSALYTETSIWSYDAASSVLAFHWIDPNLSEATPLEVRSTVIASLGYRSILKWNPTNYATNPAHTTFKFVPII